MSIVGELLTGTTRLGTAGLQAFSVTHPYDTLWTELAEAKLELNWS